MARALLLVGHIWLTMSHASVVPACSSGNSTALPFCDPSLPITQRVHDLIARLTLAEKLPQLRGGIGGGITPAIPRLGVPAYQYHSEGLHGIRTTCGLAKSKLYSSVFPQVTGMAATGNLSLVSLIFNL